MSEPKQAGRPDPESPGPAYEKPEITWEEDLGTRPGLIAACAKQSPIVPPCDTGVLSS